MKFFSQISQKQWSVFFVGAVGCALVLNFCIAYFDLSYFDNDVVRRYQIQKLENLDGVESIIVGDSSAGNAIDARYWSELSGKKTVSLALTGSFGLAGSFEMMVRAYEKNPDIKNIFIIQTPDIWRRPFAPEGIFKFGCGTHLTLWAEQFSRNPYIECFEFSTQFRNILRYARHVVQPTFVGRFFPETKRITTIDSHSDYLTQESETYANGGKQVLQSDMLQDFIEPTNVAIFHQMDEWCRTHAVHCVYMHGPLHESVYEGSLGPLKAIQEVVHNAKSIQSIEKVFFYKNEMIGDSVDHIQGAFKKQVTREYFLALPKGTY